MITLDDPRHLRLRSLVNSAFTPKVVARVEASVRERARCLVMAFPRRLINSRYLANGPGSKGCPRSPARLAIYLWAICRRCLHW
jgi:hypothetical protein